MTAPAPARRWWILAVIGVAQLMVILDNSIVNIALPSAQADLGFSDAQRQWVVTAYALAFGSLLLLGGRLSDLFGRRAAFVVGLVGFAVASVLGGLAPDFGILVGARALQGVFGAVLAPAALSLLTTTFPSGRDRGRAFGVFAALAGSGAAIGLLLGGALTEYVDWRWCMYVNAVFAAVALVGALVLLPRMPSGTRPRLDIVGTLTASAGLFGVVFGFSSAETEGWSSPLFWGFLAGGVVLLVVFVLVQRSVAAPLLPLRVLLDRHRGGSFLTILLLTTGMFSLSLFLAYVLQQDFGLSPVLTGVAFLPMVACIVAASTTMPSLLLPRVGPKPLIFAGLLLGAGALFWFSRLDVGDTYASGVLGPLMVMGLGMGTAMSTSINTATLGVEPGDAGVASATVNTMQQVGGSVGTASLSSVAGTAAASYAMVAGPGASVRDVALHGYTSAFLLAAGIFAAGAVVCGLIVPAGRPHRQVPEQPEASRELASATTGGDADGDGPSASTLEPVTDREPAMVGAGASSAGAAAASPNGAGARPSPTTAPAQARRTTPAPSPTRRSAPVVTAGSVLDGRVVGAGADTAVLTLVDVTDGAQVDRASADAQGRYRLTAQRPGTYLLVVGAPGSRPVAERLTVDGPHQAPDLRLVPTTT